MSGNFNLGRNNEFGSIDFSKIKGRITKEVFLEQSPELSSIFDIFDTDKNEVLSRAEINTLQNQLMGVDKDRDNTLSKQELSQLLDSDGKNIGKRLSSTVMAFLSSIRQISEDDAVANVEDNEDGTSIVTYADGTVEKTFADGAVEISSEKNGIKIVSNYDSLGRLIEETSSDGTETTKDIYNYDDNGNLTSNVIEIYVEENLQSVMTIVGNKRTVEDKIAGTIVTTEPVDDSNTVVTIQANGVRTVQLRDENYEIINEIITDGNISTFNIYAPRANGAIYQEKHNITRTETLENGDIKTTHTYINAIGNIILEESINNQKQWQYIRDVDGNEYGIYYDGNGNSKTVVQDGESPALIAQRFGVDLNELLELNSDKLKGSGNNKYFEVGAEILIPREVRADEEVLQTRLPAEEAIARYERRVALELQEALMAEMDAQHEEIRAIYEEKKATKARRRDTATHIINNLYNGIDQNFGTGRKFWSGIRAINADNVAEVLEGYPATGGESLFHAIDDESFITKKGEHYLKIFNCLVERARAAGVPESTISSFERDWFRHEAPETSADYKAYVQKGEDLGLDSSWFQNTNCQYMQDDPDKMNEICVSLCAVIKGYELYLTEDEAISLEELNLSPEQMNILVGMFGDRIENANSLFTNQVASDGWAGDVANWFAEVLWYSDNIEELVGEDIDEAREVLTTLQKGCTSYNQILRATFTNSNRTLIPEFNSICNEVLGRNLNWNSEADVQLLINFLNSPECQERYSGVYCKYSQVTKNADKKFRDTFKNIFDMDFDPAMFVAYTRKQRQFRDAENAKTSLERWQHYKGENIYFSDGDIFNNSDLLKKMLREIGREVSDEPLPIAHADQQAELLRRGEEFVRNAARDYYNENTQGIRIATDADISNWGVNRNMDPRVRNYLEYFLNNQVIARETAYEQALNGNNYEELKSDYENTYTAVFGTKNDIMQRVLLYNQSQEIGAGTIKGITAGTIGLAAMAAAPFTGGGSVATVTALTIGLTAPVFIELSDAMSTDRAQEAWNKGDLSLYIKTTMNEFDIENTMKQVIMGAIMMPVGMGVGQVVLSVELKSLARYALMVTTDTLLGAGTEYAMTGEVTVAGTVFNATFALAGNILTLTSITPKKVNNTPDSFDSNLFNDGLHVTRMLREQEIQSMQNQAALNTMRDQGQTNPFPRVTSDESDVGVIFREQSILDDGTIVRRNSNGEYEVDVVVDNGRHFIIKDQDLESLSAKIENVKSNFNSNHTINVDESSNHTARYDIEEFKRNHPLDIEALRSKYEDSTCELLERCYDADPELTLRLLEDDRFEISYGYDKQDVALSVNDFLTLIKDNPDYSGKIKGYLDGGYNISRTYNLIKGEINAEQAIINSLSQNRNLSVTDVNELSTFIKNNKELSSDVLELSSRNMSKADIFTELENLIQTRQNVQNSLETAFPYKMAELRSTLGDEFYNTVKWEKLFTSDMTDVRRIEVLNEMNEASKFFARTTINEQRYGKNFNWARQMNEISSDATAEIISGKSGSEVLEFIAQRYGHGDNRDGSGVLRIYDENLEGSGENGYITPYNRFDAYPEYYERFSARAFDYNNVNAERIRRTSPYDDIELTTFHVNSRTMQGTMYHGNSKCIDPCMTHIDRIQTDLQPLIDKVQRGEALTPQEITTAHNKISEAYFLLANTVPYLRGTNGICDVYMRSMYQALGIDMPALKRGVSLDLESFCYDLPDYQRNWLSFFEESNIRIESAYNSRVNSNFNDEVPVRGNFADEIRKSGIEIDSNKILYIEQKLSTPEQQTLFIELLKQNEGTPLSTLVKIAADDKIRASYEYLKTIEIEGISRFSNPDSMGNLIDIPVDQLAKIPKEIFGLQYDGKYLSPLGTLFLIEVRESNPGLFNRFVNTNETEMSYSPLAIKNLDVISKNNTEFYEYILQEISAGNVQFSCEFIENLPTNNLGSIYYRTKILAELKYADGSPRLNDMCLLNLIKSNVDIEFIKNILCETNPDGTYKYNEDITDLLEVYRKYYNDSLEFMQMVDEMGNARFNGTELLEIMESGANSNVIRNLCEAKNNDGSYKYSSGMILELLKSKDFVGTKNVIDKIITKCRSGNISYKNFVFDSESNTYQIKITDNEKMVFDFDGEFLYRRFDENIYDSGKLIFSNSIIEGKNGSINQEIWSCSDIENHYNVTIEDGSSSRFNQISNAESITEGAHIMSKTLATADGVKTDYVFIEGPNGRSVDITVTDSTGKILLKNEQKFEVISDNHYRSIENGVTYDIVYQNDKVVVTRNDGSQVEISIGDNDINAPGVISRSALPVMKQLPGSVYFKIKEFGLKKIGIGIDGVEPGNAQYSPETNVISLGVNYKSDLYTFLHEFGHYVDNFKLINQDSEFLSIYNKEREAFFKSASETERQDLAYFVRQDVLYDSTRNMQEFIAESQALFYADPKSVVNSRRTALLQKYFPETFAKASELLNNKTSL